MKTSFKNSPILGTAAALCALFAFPLVIEQIAGVDFGMMQQAAAAESGGNSGGSGGAKGGKDSGGTSHSSGSSQSGGSGGSKGGGHTSDSNQHGSSQNADHGSTPHSGGMAGGLKLRHGMGKNHVGHVPGQHGDATAESEKGQKGQNGKRRGGSGGHDVFAGGTGLGGTEHVPEGVATAVVVADAAPVQVAATEQISNGFGPQHRFRFRYWGGRNIPDDGGGGDDGGDDGDGGDDPTVVVVTPTFANTGGGGPTSSFTLAAAASCDDHVPGTLFGWDRYSRRNMERMDKVIRSLAPEVSGEAWMSKSYLVANIQDELEKPKPDTTLVGTYFGLVATNPVSTDAVKSACYALCVGVDGDQAHEIAKAAEVQRLVLK